MEFRNSLYVQFKNKTVGQTAATNSTSGSEAEQRGLKVGVEKALCRKCSGGRSKMTSNGSSRPEGSLEDHLQHYLQSSGQFLRPSSPSTGHTGITNGAAASSSQLFG